MRRKTAVGFLSLAAATALLAGHGTAAAQAQPAGFGWAGSWSASVHLPGAPFAPNWSEQGFTNHTVRQVVRISTGGASARIRLSNVYGKTPLRLAGATIAKAAEGAGVQPGTVRPLTFGLSRSTVVPAGREIASDPALLPVSALDRLAVTFYFAEPTGPSTFHFLSSATSYRASGDHRSDVAGTAFTETSESWYYLSGVETLGLGSRRGVVATFGDSITDGAGSTVNADNRYPDELAELYGGRRGVVNAGIGGNRVLNDSVCFGEKATTRFQRDVASQPQVSTVVVLEGINDIGMSEIDFGDCTKPNPRVTAAELIAGHRELIKQAHANGIKAVGATVLPFKGAMYFTERGEAVRDELNNWIRTSGEYDAVVDLDRVTADPNDPDALRPAYDSGDKLHPSDAGYRAMAKAVALVVS